jgi:hypothetical protein
MLAHAKSEKGEGFFSNRARWRAESIFGAVDGICQTVNRTALRAGWQELGLRLGAYPLVVCDDDAKEIADFIALDPKEKRIAFVHAKEHRRVERAADIRCACVGMWQPDLRPRGLDRRRKHGRQVRGSGPVSDP